MANIKIQDLQPTEIELIELSNLEVEGIVGGSLFGTVLGWIRNGGIKIGGWLIGGGWRNGGLYISGTYRF